VTVCPGLRAYIFKPASSCAPWFRGRQRHLGANWAARGNEDEVTHDNEELTVTGMHPQRLGESEGLHVAVPVRHWQNTVTPEDPGGIANSWSYMCLRHASSSDFTALMYCLMLTASWSVPLGRLWTKRTGIPSGSGTEEHVPGAPRTADQARHGGSRYRQQASPPSHLAPAGVLAPRALGPPARFHRAAHPFTAMTRTPHVEDGVAADGIEEFLESLPLAADARSAVVEQMVAQRLMSAAAESAALRAKLAQW
jgi:hypothetical protein